MIDQSKPEPVFISKMMHQHIKYLWRQSRLCGWQIADKLKSNGDVIEASTIHDWIAGRMKHADPAQWQKVIEVLEAHIAMPIIAPQVDTNKRSVGHPRAVAGTMRLSVTPAMHAEYMDELKRTGADERIDIVQAFGVPEGLNDRVILILRLQSAKTVRDDYWAFIMTTLKAMRDCGVGASKDTRG